MVKKEIAIWKRMRHRNCVKLFEVMDDPEEDKIYMVSEMVTGGCVMPDELVCEPMGEGRAKQLFLQCLDGMEFLHAHDVVHRDLKPGNILVTGDAGQAAETVKITDFGVSQFFEDGDDEVKNTVGTASFMAPEMLSVGSFKAKQIDIWALAATLYMFVFGHPPFMVDGGMSALNEAIMTAPLEIPAEPSISAELVDLLQKLMVKDPYVFGAGYGRRAGTGREGAGGRGEREEGRRGGREPEVAGSSWRLLRELFVLACQYAGYVVRSRVVAFASTPPVSDSFYSRPLYPLVIHKTRPAALLPCCPAALLAATTLTSARPGYGR